MKYRGFLSVSRNSFCGRFIDTTDIEVIVYPRKLYCIRIIRADTRIIPNRKYEVCINLNFEKSLPIVHYLCCTVPDDISNNLVLLKHSTTEQCSVCVDYTSANVCVNYTSLPTCIMKIECSF